MLSFKFILIAAAAFASMISAVPTPEIGNSLNIAQRSPGIVDGIAVDVIDVINNAAADVSKRGGSESSCKEVIQKSHDDIADIVVKIS